MKIGWFSGDEKHKSNIVIFGISRGKCDKEEERRSESRRVYIFPLLN
jgi:hypothetical protein